MLVGADKDQSELGSEARQQLQSRHTRAGPAGKGVITTYGVPKMSAYARLKRYRQRRSLERERTYLAKDWPPGHEHWTARQWASRKRWFIYYHRRRQERELGFPLSPRRARHWIGPAERERKRRKRNRPTCNPIFYGGWVRF